MQNFTSSDARFVFEGNINRVYQDMLKRLKPHGSREGTDTGPESDGKTPFLDIFEANPDTSYEINLANAIVNSWLQGFPVIYPGELLVGVPRPRRLMQEHFSYGIQLNEWILNADVYKDRADEIRARLDKVRDKLDPGDIGDMYKRQSEIFGIPANHAAFTGLWWTGGYQGHTVPSYEKLLRCGIPGLLEEIDESIKKYGNTPVLAACRIIVEGLAKYSLLYAGEADRLAAESTGEDKARYEKIAANCRSIAVNKPETLYEAEQLAWFYCLWDWVDCVGRFDQYMYPFYEKAKEEDETAADELIASMMMKFFEHGIHNITIGGVLPENGEDASNDLSYITLHILRNFHNSHPRMTLRISDKTPDTLIALAVELWSEGMSDPSVVSDTLVIDSFANKYKVPIEDARDYSCLGCQEIEIPGKSNFGCEDGALSLIKILEFTMNNGANRFDESGYQIGLATGHLYDYKTYEEFEAAYFNQIAFFVKYWAELSNIGAEVRAKNFSKLVKTVTTYDCVAKGKSLDAGGSRYNFGCVETVGFAAAADALYAIKKLVFEDKVLDAKVLDAAMAANFEGYDAVHRMVQNLPKFGNDVAEVDQLASRLLDHFWAECGKYVSFRGGVFLGACSLLQGGIQYGYSTWANADGRVCGEPLGNTIGPVSGRDVNGLTAMLNSVAALDLSRGLGGTTCNVRISKDITQGEEGRAAIVALIKTYLATGGMMAQITTANVDELRDAQEHPEKHEDLIVRVGGFSIRFNELDRTSQNEIILRYID